VLAPELEAGEGFIEDQRKALTVSPEVA
jgi:hypothetical protein